MSIEAKMTQYQDQFFDNLHKLIRSVSFLSQLSNESVRELVLKLKRVPALSKSVIINIREKCDQTYFIKSGVVCVSIVDPKTGNKFPFQYLTEGSSFNFMN
jgi:CRP-like cAMP-binding protein